MDDLRALLTRGLSRALLTRGLSRALLTRGLSRGQLIALDAAGAAVYTTLTAAAAAGRPDPYGLPLWVRCLLVAGVGLPLAARRLWPLSVFAVVLLVSAPAVGLGVVRDPCLAAACALYVVALRRPRPPWVPTLAIGVLSLPGILLAALAGTSLWWMSGGGLGLTGLLVLGAAWTVGRAVRERRAYAARATAQMAAGAVTAERLRIARELHDVVAHGMTVIAVKAGVANHVLRERPDEAQAALSAIEATSRSALVELRHMLGVLRSPEERGGPPAGLVPAPGVAELPELVDRAAAAGVRVDLDVRGAERVPEGVGLSTYRIVQEALTNVVRHAAPARCRVVVEAGPGEVRIEVTDDGPGHRVLPGGGGHGLVGMRERVALYGGSFRAGPRPEGGFEVAARMPYGP